MEGLPRYLSICPSNGFGGVIADEFTGAFIEV
jgi:hypothetical protein